MKQTDGKAIQLAGLRVSAILNTSSGSCDAECGEKLKTILCDAGIMLLGVDLVEGKDVEKTLDRILSQNIDILVVLGGDGTIRTAAERCGRSETALLALPGGTMNMLVRSLYGKGSWAKILSRTLAAPLLFGVSGGEVDGHRFFCAAIFGSPALWADAREAVRKNHWLNAFARALRAYHLTFSRKIYYRIDGGDASSTMALSTICPVISAIMKVNADALEVVILDPHDVGDALHLAWSAVFSSWREDRAVASNKAERVDLQSGGKISAILDGEKVLLPPNTHIGFLQNCFTSLVPLQSEVRPIP